MLRYVVIALALTLQGCVPRHKPPKPPITVIIEMPTYVIGQQSETEFLIWATSIRIAQEAADFELKCKSRICSMRPAGVFLDVQRPIIVPKERQ